jgi:hypothetical protein
MDEGSPEPAGSAGDGRGSGEDGGAVGGRCGVAQVGLRLGL